MKYKIILLMLLLFVVKAAAEDTAGTTGFTFLKVNYSARAAAMGNAYTGLANDAGAVFFNPAGLVQIKSPQASATYMSYFDGIQCGSAVFVLPRNEKMVLGFFAKGLTATEERTLANAEGQYAGTNGTFGMSNIVLGTSVAHYLIDVLDVGISVKYIRESLDDNNGSALAFDVGILHQTTNENLFPIILIMNMKKTCRRQ
jgi:long-subunit fatty acid transport protein